jgi:hypothetical protein
MRNILRTSTNQNVAGNSQDRLFVVGTVDVRARQPMRTRHLYQHANQALARFLEAFERHLKPAMALALTPAASSRSPAAMAAPRCWQRIKTAGQHASARRS